VHCQQQIAQRALQVQQAIERGEQVVVGVNRFRDANQTLIPTTTVISTITAWGMKWKEPAPRRPTSEVTKLKQTPESLERPPAW
jgi:methylmalonyl-CoA mutase N-terminal domain/subunit